MLSPADERLVARQPGLPGLMTVLDGDRIAERVAEAFEDPSLELRPRYVRFKPGTSCVVAFDVRTSEGSGVAYAGAFADHNPAKVDGLARQRGGEVGRTVAFHDERVAFRLVPDDLRLPALRRLRDGERTAFLQRVVPGSPALWTASATLLRWKPERRAVVRLDVDGEPTAVVKSHAGAAFDTAKVAARAIPRRSTVRTPPVLGRSRRHRTLVYPWVRGRVLDASSSDPELLAEVGVALAELHTLPGGPLRPFGGAETRAQLDASVRALRALDPDLGVTARVLAARIAARLDLSDGERVFLHGDASPDQFVVDDTGVVILDLDRAVAGDRHRDLGQLLATIPAGGRDAVLAGYRSVGAPVEPARLATAIAAALVHRAVEPFRHRRTDWVDEAGRILDAATETLG